MKYLNRKSNYDKYPQTVIFGYDKCAWSGYDDVCLVIEEKLNEKNVLVIETYPGVIDEEVLTEISKRFKAERIIKSIDIFYDSDKLDEMLKDVLTEDRVRGFMYYGKVNDFIDKEKLEKAKQEIKEDGLTIIYGFAASLISQGDVLVYADLTRWQAQLRYRKGRSNYKCHNENEDNLKKYKRGYFVEWRIADKLKFELFDKIDFYLDTNVENNPKMVTGEAIRGGLKQIVKQPFRLVPYFDSEVWGGQWMKEVCNLDKEKDNYAWSFDGVPEENSLFLKYGNIKVETPAMNLVKYQPNELLGPNIYSRFGAEYPIRFDFLDTMEGQNLSLQVHPLNEYIKSKFGMSYTQDESYYILDCQNNGGVYLGLKEGINKEEMIFDLENAQDGGKSFEADKYVNRFKASKHDHYLIPAGTIHCSSADCMVFEISATPYIFTFKLWDWNRLGKDGLPRPIHLEDGKKVIQWNRTTDWVKKNLVNNFEVLVDNPEYKEVKTGLHELEFIETRVFTSKNKVLHKTNNTVNQLNLVDGTSAIIESPNNEFAPFTVHYVETFIIPACIEEYTIKPEKDGEEIKYLKAYVRE